MTTCLKRAFRVTSFVMATLAVTGPMTRAEVSVTVEPGTRPRAVRFSAIQDGGDPVPFVWSRFSTSTSNVVLNENGDLNGDGPPTILGNPADVCLVAWSKNSAAGYDVVASRFEDGVWSAPQVLANSASDELDPVLVQGVDGVIHLFYWEAGAQPRIMQRTAPADLSAWSAPAVVSDLDESACRPQAVFHDGVLRVVYEVHDYGFGQTPRQVVVGRFESGELIREVVAITHNVNPIWPQIHSRAGRLWIDWEDSPGQMFWKRRDSSTGIWEPTQIEPFTSQMQKHFFVRGTIRHIALE